MNQSELVAHVAQATGLTKAQAGKAVDAFFAAITDTLKKGEEVRITGFGTFSVAERAASEGRNPRTGEKIKIAASKQAKFSAGKTLKDSVNGQG
ncbi:HU family DNA-binding protein [Arenibaculum pallidiluteum]|uniref:HU family DNA-binding protein n=1 Tax=Arenibaculum pallidiluteum TaxID=2812559 RepID=UPI001A9679A3|nr:HU family DNA-binding protein [Arenibaculum pallidiluteum]